jgi:hypothetical protein
MIFRIAVIWFLAVSGATIVSAQSQPSQLTREERKKREELRRTRPIHHYGKFTPDDDLIGIFIFYFLNVIF